MKKILLAAAAFAAGWLPARAESPLHDFSLVGAFDYESQYVFRGKKITNSAFEPKIEMGYPTFGGSIYTGMWTNLPFGRHGVQSIYAQPDEIDLYGGYTFPLDLAVSPGLRVDAGNTFYWYPNTSGQNSAITRTDELYIGLAYDSSPILFGVNLNPALYYYYDFMLDQSTVELSLAYKWDLSKTFGKEGVSLDPRFVVGWLEGSEENGTQRQPGVSAWRNAYWYYAFMVDFNYPLNKVCTAFVGFRYEGNNDGNGPVPPPSLRAQAGGTPNNLWGGCGIRFSQ
jgi:uncharacterized protein (TIGR02001 family)